MPFSKRALFAGMIPLAAVFAYSGAAQAQVAGQSVDRLAIEARAGVAHDTNISGGNTQFSDQRGITPEDTTYSVGATVLARMPIGRQLLFLTASGDAQRYQHNKVFDGTNFNLSGGFTGRLGPCTGTASAGYSRQLTPGSELLIAIQKNIAKQKYVDAQATCTSGHLIGGLQGRHTRVDNSAHNAGLIDYDSDSVAVNVGYAGETLGNLSLLGQYTKVSYDQPPAVGIVVDGYKSYEFGVRYYRRIGLRLSGTADLTYDHTKTDFVGTGLLVPVKTEFNGWSADVLMAYRVSPRTQLELLYARRVQPAQVIQTGFDVAETFKLTGLHRFGSRFVVSGGVSSVHTKYDQAQLGLFGLRSDDVRSAFATASMQVGRHLKVAVDGQHTDRKANIPLFTYKSDRVGITIAGEF